MTNNYNKENKNTTKECYSVNRTIKDQNKYNN